MPKQCYAKYFMTKKCYSDTYTRYLCKKKEYSTVPLLFTKLQDLFYFCTAGPPCSELEMIFNKYYCVFTYFSGQVNYYVKLHFYFCTILQL